MAAGTEEMKVDDTTSPPTTETTPLSISPETRTALVERLQFFFSDANLRQDKFMRQHLWYKTGSIPWDDMMRFKTIQQHTTSRAVVQQVAKDELSQLLVVSDDGLSRKIPFTKECMSKNEPVSLYIKNLPIANGRFQVSTQQVRQAFSAYEGLVLVKLCFKNIESDSNNKNNNRRKSRQTEANGTALVEFDTVEHLQAAAVDLLTFQDGNAKDPKVPLTIGDKPITVYLLSEFKAMKESQRLEEKKRKAADGGAEDNDTSTQPAPPEEPSFTPDCVVRLDAVPTDCDRETIFKTVCEVLGWKEEDIGKKMYIDYSRGQTHAHLQFKDDDYKTSVEKFVSKLEAGGVTLGGMTVDSNKVRVLQDDKETEYWKAFTEFKKTQKANRSNNGSNKRFKK